LLSALKKRRLSEKNGKSSGKDREKCWLTLSRFPTALQLLT
jgi:hypothetical protein